VDAEGEGVAQVGDQHGLVGPPCPSLPGPQRDRHDGQEQDGEGQLVQGVATLEQRDVVRGAGLRGFE
jgi:hypothetical protein